MSTKVYTAYKLKNPKDLWKVVADLRVQARKHITRALKYHRNQMAKTVSTESEDYKKALTWAKTKIKAQRQVADREMYRLFRLSSASSERDLWDFSVSITFRQHKGHIYLIPFCDMFLKNVLNFMKRHPGLEDFCYWNNVDQKRSVSKKDWDRRGKVWDALDDAGGWDNYLVLEICTPNHFFGLLHG